MGVLFLISTAALLALLWAAFSIAQHVRRARRRQRKAVQAVAEAKLWLSDLPTAANADGSRAMKALQVKPAVEEASPGSVSSPRDWSQLRHSASGILGSTFTGRSPKL